MQGLAADYMIDYEKGTIPIENLPIGVSVLDPTWVWEFRTGNNTDIEIIKPVIWNIVAKNHYVGLEPHVTLLTEELIGKYLFDNSDNRGSQYGCNNWGESGTVNATFGLRPWLNSTGIHSGEGFYHAFSESFKHVVLETILPNVEWKDGDAYPTSDYVFLPSSTELGGIISENTYQIGAIYPYFSGMENSKIVAHLCNEIEWYWTRSPDSRIDSGVLFFYGSKDFYTDHAYNNKHCARPALNLKFGTLVSKYIKDISEPSSTENDTIPNKSELPLLFKFEPIEEKEESTVENDNYLDEKAKVEIDERYDKYLKDQNYVGLIELSTHIAELINKGVYVKEDTNIYKKCKKIVGVYLTNKDVEDALKWISQIESNFDVKNIKEKLEKINEMKRGIMVEDIKDAFLLRRLGKLHKELESPEKAFQLYEKSLEIEPNNKYSLNGIGGVCNAAGWLDKALKYYLKCLEVDRDVVAYTGLGATYRDLELHNEALQCYLNALEIDSTNTYANNGIGAVYFDLGRYTEGETHFAVAGRNDGYLISLAEGYISKGMTENAIRCLELILTSVPDHREAKYLYEKYKDDYKY